jgi:hypothetical protein
VAYLLITPSVKEAPAGGGPLFMRYGLLRGISLLVDADGGVTEVRYPTEHQVNAAHRYYIGGHEYVVDGEDAQVLLDAGYSSNLTPIGGGGEVPGPGFGYGSGPYGSGPYGGN